MSDNLKKQAPESDAEGKVWTEWFDRADARRFLWRALWASCAAAVLAEVLVTRKGYFGVDGWFGFYAALGFAACAAMIFGAKGLGIFLKRDEDYYGDAAEDGDGAEGKGGRGDA